jgi:3-oxoadipate enol-lactonase
MKVADTRVTDEFIADNPDVVAATIARADHSAFADEANHQWGREQQLEARKYHDCWDRLADIKCPVWLAGGHYDGIATPEAMRNMASRLPHAELTFYEGGHLFMVEDGRVFPDLINFFKSQS